MTYTIFVSHATPDHHLAAALARMLRDVFQGRIQPYLAVEHIRGGDLWKEELRTHIGRSDAIISIITPSAIDRPWLHVEWSPFWLGGKQFYVLATNGVDTSRLVEPMRDSQIVSIQDKASLTKFLDGLGERAGFPPSAAQASEGAAAMLAAMGEAMLADRQAYFEQFGRASTGLPNDNSVRRGILEHFYGLRDIDGFKTLFARLQDDPLMAEIALWVVRQSDLQLAADLCSEITGQDYRRRVASGMIKAGHESARELRRVVDSITNDAERRNLALEMLQADMAETEMFSYVVNGMKNMSELRKPGIQLVQRGEYTRPVFGVIVERIAQINRTALRDIALEFIAQGAQHVAEFQRMIDDLIVEKPSAAVPVLEELKKADPEMLPPLHDRHGHLGAGNAAVAWLRKELGLE